MRERVNVAAINSMAELEQLAPWLKSFGHQPIAEPAGRFHVFTKLARILALTQQFSLNVLAPALNPNVCTPRETVEIADTIRAWSTNTPGGLNVAVPIGSPMNAHMSKLGYKPKSVLYEVA